MNVLVLHQMGDPRYRREAVRSLEYMIPECRRDLNCVVHDAAIPFPDYLKEIDYHLIVLGPTFLCNRFDSKSFTNTLSNYDFIRMSNACKVGLPQDDYNCSKRLDDWMVSWAVDRVYTVCPDHWGILYPGYSGKGEICLGYTGYISESWIESWSHLKPHSARNIDVSYRSINMPVYFGVVGNLKCEIAHRFLASFPKTNLRLDISVNQKDMIPGSKWHDFLKDSKFCLATPSGSSLFDPFSYFKDRVTAYTSKYPSAKFDEIAQKCFPGEDGKYLFTPISPRNIEAALAQTVQIATAGLYSGLMRPMENYLPLEQDCSNIGDVLGMMSDTTLVNRIKRYCKESFLAEPRLRREVIVDEIIDFSQSVITKRNILGSSQAKVEKVFGRYENDLLDIARRYWLRRRIKLGVKAVAVKLGARFVKRLLLGPPHS